MEECERGGAGCRQQGGDVPTRKNGEPRWRRKLEWRGCWEHKGMAVRGGRRGRGRREQERRTATAAALERRREVSGAGREGLGNTAEM
jgi:hypothetical protein